MHLLYQNDSLYLFPVYIYIEFHKKGTAT